MSLTLELPEASKTSPLADGAPGLPVAFGGCAGLFHPAGGRTGVLMLGPWGFEDACTRIGWRRLAETLAARGYPVLRFDLPGTGDSLDPPADARTLAAWRRALRDGLGTLGVLGLVDQALVLGLGLGADLAVEAATLTAAPGAGPLPGIAGLVLAAPVMAGRVYARELAAWAGMMQAPGRAAPADEGLVVGGHRMAPDLLADLKSLSTVAAATPVPHVIIAERGDGAREKPLVERYRALGVPVETMPLQGFDGWVSDPTSALVPETALAALALRLTAVVPPGPVRGGRNDGAPDARLAGDGFVEVAERFGPDGRLYGVRCLPVDPSAGRADPSAGRADPVVVFLNSGRDPHVGWGRSAVEHARRLARAGTASFRLDLSGIGEASSDPAAPAEPLYSDAHQGDVSAALAHLAAAGHGPAVLVGRCSGAFAALHAGAFEGEAARVGAVVAVNPLRLVWDPKERVEDAIRHSFRSASTYPRQLLDLILGRRRQPVPWARLARDLSRRVLERAGSSLERLAGPLAPKESRFRRARALFDTLSARRIPVRLVYSADDGGLDELAIHFGKGGRGLKRHPLATITLVPDADHNLTPRAARDRLHAVIEETVATVRRAG